MHSEHELAIPLELAIAGGVVHIHFDLICTKGECMVHYKDVDMNIAHNQYTLEL
jgi:hypothetical protein